MVEATRAEKIQNCIDWNIATRDRCEDPVRKRRLQRTIDNLNKELRNA